MTAPQTIWHEEPSESDCQCVRDGDFEDTRGCPIHSASREPAVGLKFDEGPSEPPF